MAPRALFVLSLLAVALAPHGGAHAEPGDDPELRRLLAVVRRDEEPETWAAAVRKLRALGADAPLDRTLRTLLEDRRRERDGAASAIRALVAKVGDGRREEKRRLAWEEAREDARAWLFDPKSFPDVPDPITGPGPGYDESMRRAKRAIETYQALRRPLDRALGPLRRLSPEAATGLSETLRTAEERLERVARALGVHEERASTPALVTFFLAATTKRFEEAAKRYAKMPDGWERLCAFEAYGRAILEHGRRRPGGHGKRAREALDSLNLYRRAIGHSPLAVSEKLARMARGHSAEMRERGYLSHDSPVRENRTTRHRARNAGYGGRVEECISGRGDPGTAVEVWKWDGGHHRTMIHAEHLEAGISDRGPITLDVGRGEPGTPPGIRY